MELSFHRLGLDGPILVRTPFFQDSRGSFTELYRFSEYSQKGNMDFFVQDNLSVSKKGVIRGLHYQTGEYAQGKLIRVIKGEVWDVVVDLRKNSKTYGKWESVSLSEQNGISLWIPPGFAHGFQVVSSESVCFYKCTHEYNPKSEVTIQWNDTDLRISWPIPEPIISEKDSRGLAFRDAPFFL